MKENEAELRVVESKDRSLLCNIRSLGKFFLKSGTMEKSGSNETASHTLMVDKNILRKGHNKHINYAMELWLEHSENSLVGKDFETVK